MKNTKNSGYKSTYTNDYKNTDNKVAKNNYNRTILILLATLLIVLLLSSGYFIIRTGYWPAKVETVAVQKRLYNRALESKTELTVMSYNVKFMQSNENNYYFNGEDNDTWVKKDTIIATINNIAKIIDENDPDVILLQEVDINSSRTHRINEIDALLNKISGEYQYWACTPYWKSEYIPIEQVGGKIDMQLCTISKYPITEATRYALPHFDNSSMFKRQFLPKRAILSTTITVNNKKFNLYNLHLSHYPAHASIHPQLKVLEDLLTTQANENDIVGGDFNLIPDKKFLQYIPENERVLYNQEVSSFKLLFEKYQPIPTMPDLYGNNFKNYFTSMGTSASETPPDRTVDYFFLSKQMKVVKYSVIYNDLSSILSDHLPIMVTIALD